MVVELSRVLYTHSGAPPVQPDGTPLLQSFAELKWHRKAWLQSTFDKTPGRFESQEASYASLVIESKKQGIPINRENNKYFDHLEMLQVNEVPHPGRDAGESMFSTNENQKLFLLRSVFPEEQVFVPMLVHPPEISYGQTGG